MGSETVLSQSPHFRVRAAGARVQSPGCPEYAREALGAHRLDALCRGECYSPGDSRRLLTRIEVVRIRPQRHNAEPVSELIDDPWLSLPCPQDTAGCVVEFSDPDYLTDGRDTVYYARAIQEPTPAVNGGNLRCKRDENGECIALAPCHGSGALTPYQDDCLSEIEERAWSSPIWVDQLARAPSPAWPTPPQDR